MLRNTTIVLLTLFSLAACTPVKKRPDEPKWASAKDRGEVKIVKSPELPRVVFSTARGNIMLELFEDNTPNTVANMIYIIEKGMYKGHKFHRVEPGKIPGSIQIIQGGGTSTSSLFDWQIKNDGLLPSYGELKNTASTISMARSGHPDTAANQFFINIRDNLGLERYQYPYCVFGKVIEGMDVVKAVQAGDDFLDTWVVQKRDHKYIPSVKRTGQNHYAPAE